ncbi:hypothetical protein [Psychrobacter sp. van23A]|uniref:hypothetical protein n=1 Tax=Psychrobacter TaxID=497 RepID=UPI0027BA7497|nr:hypothetical protein [Psychrobacter sp. van23A]WLW67194.1 hypothetical protein RAH45_04560 [Psychrobacter sp. van23A]
MLKKFKEKSASQKFDAILNVLFITFFIAWNFLDWQGRDFPQESELHYSEGIIANTEFSIALQSLNDPNQLTLYGCSYNVFNLSYLDPVWVVNILNPDLERMQELVGIISLVFWETQ